MLTVAVVLLVVTALLTAALAYSKYRHSYWSSRGIPTAPGLLPFVGHTHKFFTNKTPMWLFTDEVYRKVGGSGLVGLFELHNPTLLVFDPELIKAIFIKDFDHFVDRRNFRLTGKRDEFFNEMLTQATGDHWKGIRSVISPAFTSGRMKGMFPLVGAKVDELVTYLHQEIGSNPAIRLKRCFGLFTLEVISSCAFGIETNSLAEGTSTFHTMAEKLTEFKILGMLKFLLALLFPKIFQLLKLSLLSPEVTFFKDIVTETIRHRDSGEQRRGDFLDIMLEARQDQQESTSKIPKYPLKDLTIEAESFLFIIGGYDTTTSTLSFVTFLLAQHPTEQQRLREEVRDIIKEHGTLTYQSVMEAKILDACISETLRLCPPAFYIERQCTKDYTLPDTSVIVPEKTIVGVPAWSLHRDPRYWSEPEIFSPDRFLPENKGMIKAGTYLPFGLGPRNCIGMRFALMEVKLALAKIVDEFELSCVPGREQIEYSNHVGNMRPHEDLSLIFTPVGK
ncbi:cytochrome P450 3A11-like isoform X2 [Panulirus ornatus]